MTGFVYPCATSSKQPLVEGYNKRRLGHDELRTYLDDSRYAPGIIPQSFGLLAVDFDNCVACANQMCGDCKAINRKCPKCKDKLCSNCDTVVSQARLAFESDLESHGIEYLTVRSKSRGWHTYLRCDKRLSLPAKFDYRGASGDLRHRQNILLYRDTSARMYEWLARKPSGMMDAALRDAIFGESVAVKGHASATPASDRAYDTARLRHGRRVYMNELRGSDNETWITGEAIRDGMTPEEIMQNEELAIQDARVRMDWALKWATLRTKGKRRYRHATVVLAAMAAVATAHNGNLAWASNETYRLIAGKALGKESTSNRGDKTRAIRRILKRLEADGFIERTGNAGQQWRGKPTVEWRIPEIAFVNILRSLSPESVR